jgi:salicylate hydroxylase
MSDAPHALIAGAGIGGLTAALCLARAGFRTSLFERAKLLQEVGAGLQISPNASAILRDLGVLPRLAGAALEPEAIRIRSGRDGATLQLLPLSDAATRWGAPYLLIHRGDLQKALLDSVLESGAARAAITLNLDTEIAGFTSKDKAVEVVAQHGEAKLSYSGECLIGADGLRSLVRQRLTGTATMPAKSRYVAWRTLINATAVPPALRRPEATLWLGHKAHLVHYPLRGGSVVNLVAVVDAQIDIDWNADIWSLPGAPAEIQTRFASWHEEARRLIGAANDWRQWPLVDCAPLPQWTAGRVALLGDAAHPMLPFLAQGAAQAIEDAAMLGAMLSPGVPVAPCLAAYAAARRPRANRVQAAARRQGRTYHLGGPAEFFRDFTLKSIGAGQLLAHYNWLYQTRPAVK